MEKLKTIFQCEGFDDYYKRVLNGGKYVDPDCIDDINTPYYNFFNRIFKKERVKVVVKINSLLLLLEMLN